MDDVIVGLLAIGLGNHSVFLGLRIWSLCIWGFVGGSFVGAATVTAIFGDGFLSTVTGWIVGIVEMVSALPCVSLLVRRRHRLAGCWHPGFLDIIEIKMGDG